MSRGMIQLLFYVLLGAGAAFSLTVKIVLEPLTVEQKGTVMECKFNLEGRTFGSVIWDKDHKTFFKFSRRKVPPIEVFPVPGVNVEVEHSNKTHVVLNLLSVESSGVYSCSVTASGGGGSELAIDWANMTTVEREPTPILVATRNGVFVVDTKNYSAATTWKDAPPVLSVGYNLRRKKIYYGENGGNIINQDYSPYGFLSVILSEESVVTSITVDWLHNMLYFTDDYLDIVGMVNLTTEDRTTLLESTDGVNNPESIVVDPFQGYLFWGDNEESNKKIVASGLDGKSNRRTIINSNLNRAILTLDLDRRRLYFIGNEGLSSCKYDGSKRKVHFQHPALDYSVNSLSYFDNYIFWSRYDSGKSSSGLFYVSLIVRDPPINELPIKSILDVKVYHPDLQKQSLQYSCNLIECSHNCVVNASGSAQCVCPNGYSLSEEGTTCINGIGDTNCDEKSLTTVNSKPVCKGELVFEDGFDTDRLNTSKWQHTVRISSDHDLEFVVYDKYLSNTFIKDGTLIIKPTIMTDDIVTTGNISLIGCTASAAHLCKKQAFSYNIIPPVRSGLVNTGHTFSFRYGTITIRAKVPRGDWLFPVLNLHPTKNIYNPDYSSGVIRIASVMGNEHLRCGEPLGNKNMAAGVMLGQQINNVKTLFVSKVADKEWSEDFHIFRFTWTPEELSFSVDDQSKEIILPKGKKLIEMLGYSEQEKLEWWRQGSKLAPLDQEFYLSIGLSVGGALAFPDDCTSYGNKTCSGERKPWKNFEVKSLLKFWQKKSCWSETWGDNSALLIDYVNVKAL